MSKVTIGLLMAMAAILLMYTNHVFIALPAFVIGIFLMIRKKDR